MPRVAFHTFGCRLNQSETAALRHQFHQSGFDLSDELDGSDIVVVNTCTVTENGDADTRRLVSRLVRGNPSVAIALIGCQAQIQQGALFEWPNVKWVVGSANKMMLAGILQSHPDGVLDVPKPARTSFEMGSLAVDHRHTRANLKVQDGCDFYCAFCVIPFARGPARSRVWADIIQDAKGLIAAGHPELVMTGVNMGTYADHGRSFCEVVGALLALPGLGRLRLSSIEPTTVDDQIIEWMATHPAMCPYLHLPIQSGSDDILSAMARKYDVATVATFLAGVVKRVPGIGIGTDVMVGFPGETDAQFDETVDTLRTLPFHYFHVFPYSKRTGTRAHKWGDPVSGTVIKQRAAILRALSDRKRMAFRVGQLGRQVRVVLEREGDGGWWGVTDEFVRVLVTGVGVTGPGSRMGMAQLVRVEGDLTEAHWIG